MLLFRHYAPPADYRHLSLPLVRRLNPDVLSLFCREERGVNLSNKLLQTMFGALLEVRAS